MLWWHWLVIGLALFGAEMLAAGTFFIMFFGVGAILVGLLALAGVGGPAWVEWLLFSFFSVVSLLLLREPLLRRSRSTLPAGQVDALAGTEATLLEDIPPGAQGRAELRGATWTARNTGTAPLRRGERCRVIDVDGLVLLVQPPKGAA